MCCRKKTGSFLQFYYKKFLECFKTLKFHRKKISDKVEGSTAMSSSKIREWARKVITATRKAVEKKLLWHKTLHDFLWISEHSIYRDQQHRVMTWKLRNPRLFLRVSTSISDSGLLIDESLSISETKLTSLKKVQLHHNIYEHFYEHSSIYKPQKN